MPVKAMVKIRLMECIDRLKKFIELDAPATVIGEESFNVFATCLTVYGNAAGSAMISHIRTQNCRARGVCHMPDCSGEVDRRPSGLCSKCEAAIDEEIRMEMGDDSDDSNSSS